MSKNLARLGAIFGLLAVLLMGSMPAATAAEAHAPASVSSIAANAINVAAKPEGGGGSGNNIAGVCQVSHAGEAKSLPVNRWQDATNTLHSRMEGGVNVGAFMGTIQREWMIGTGMAFGNFVWGQGANLAEFSINYCMLSKLGGVADGIAAQIGNLLLTGPGTTLLIFLLVGSAVTVVWRGARNGNIEWGKIAQKAMIIALLGILTFGATASTGGQGEGAAYKPGIGSPGWVVMTLNNTVSSLASAPAAAFSMANNDPGKAEGPLSCKSYVRGLNEDYMRVYGSGTSSLSSAVPMVISGMWERSGLETWKTAQFGRSADEIGGQAWCRLLEWNNGTQLSDKSDTGIQGTSTVRRALFRTTVMDRNSANGGFEFANSTDFKTYAFNPQDTEKKDRSLVAWSACQLKPGANPADAGSWTISPYFKEPAVEKQEIKEEHCQSWWTGKGELGDFNWSSKASDVAKDAPNEDLADYIMTLHGNNNGAGTIAMIAYILASLGMIIVFGGISLAVLIAKIAQTLMIITMVFTAIAALVAARPMEKLGSYFKNLVGITVFIFAIQFIFAMVSMITDLLQRAGMGMLGDGIFSTLWTGFSPLIAVFVLHMMFTKVMKVPSPFSISAGMAWGAAAATGGAVALGGVSKMVNSGQRRMQSKAAGAAKEIGRGLGNKGLSAVSGGKLGNGRRQGAAPQAEKLLEGQKEKSLLEREAEEKAAAAKGPGEEAVQGAEAQGEDGMVGASVDGEVDAKLSAADLAAMGVANSQIGKGKMTREERRELREGQGSELAAARRAADDLAAAEAAEKQAEREARDPFKDRLRAAPRKALDGIANAWNASSEEKAERKEKVFKVAKGVAVGGGVVAATVVAPWAAPAMVGGWAVKNRKEIGSVVTPRGRRDRNDALVEWHRETQREQAEVAAAEYAKQVAAEKETGAGKEESTPAVPLSGQARGPADSTPSGASAAPPQSHSPAVTPTPTQRMPITPESPGRPPSGNGPGQSRVAPGRPDRDIVGR